MISLVGTCNPWWAEDCRPRGAADEDLDLPKILQRERAKTRANASGVRLMPVSEEPTANRAEWRLQTGSVEPRRRQVVQVLPWNNGSKLAGEILPDHSAKPRSSPETCPERLQDQKRMLEDVLAEFRIKGTIREVCRGPVITLFELDPAPGIKSSRVIALADDIARALSVVSVRISSIPGRDTIGIELPNRHRETTSLSDLINSDAFRDNTAKIPLALGKGIGGEPIFLDVVRMPHLLIAGSPSSGVSVGVNAMILSLIRRLTPEQCRLLLIGRKNQTLSAFNGMPHLLCPVIKDPQKAVAALRRAVGEMQEHKKRLADLGVRNIDAFNKRVLDAKRRGKKLARTVQTGFDPRTGEAVFEERQLDAEPLPYVVIVVDELADLMAVAGKEIEGLVQRLGQEARSVGIHMIMATQRPSVDVVTGAIQSNFPTRLSYRLPSRRDSRVILGERGAEQLLGEGDMLFRAGWGNVERLHGPFVSDEDVWQVTSELRQAYSDAAFEAG
jgi:S-DNA-T family DNA segregation ATPase FtsK/SpoIIIE